MNSFSQIYIMLVFGVKYRLGLIGYDWKERLYGVIGQTLNGISGVRTICIGGTSDHVHILLRTEGHVGESEILRKVKSESSRWINENRLCVGRFGWQDGGGKFAYSQSQVPRVKAYIHNQEEHHRKTSFKSEFAHFLNKFGITNLDRYSLPDDLID